MNSSPTAIGIIAEYNPFHIGHATQLRLLRKQYPLATLVAVMSGSFVQRGEPAMFTKFNRAAWALTNGCDIVLELPTVFSVSSAEGFAAGAMRLLHGVGVNAFSFGAETADSAILENTAQVLLDERVQNRFRELLQKGQFYGTALRTAVAEFNPLAAATLNNPNNLLGVEYIKASYTYNLNMMPLPLLRASLHHSAQLPTLHSSSTSDRGIKMETAATMAPSGKALRNSLADWTSLSPAAQKARLESLRPFFPLHAAKDLTKDHIFSAMTRGMFCEYSRYQDALLLTSRLADKNHLKQIAGFSEGLEHIWKKTSSQPTWEKARQLIKSNRYSYSRIDRMGAALMLNLTELLRQYALQKGPEYVRLLGFTPHGQQWLANTDAELPIIHKWGAYGKSVNTLTKESVILDNRAMDIQAFTLHNEEFRSGNINQQTSPLRIKEIP